MRPPECAICGKGYEEGSDCELVEFQMTEEERSIDQRMKEEGLDGHPPGTEWFCERHIDQAKKLRHLNLNEALKKLR